MVINEFKITNNSNNKTLKFHYAASVQDSISVNNVSFAIPGQSSSDNFVANFGGFKDLVTIDFILFNDGTDKSDDSSSIITLKQQRDYLKNVIIQGKGSGDSQSDVNYTIVYYTPDGSSNETGGIESVDINSDTKASNQYRGTIILIKGSN